MWGIDAMQRLKRREFLTLCGGAVLAAAETARSQPTPLPVVGYLASESPRLFESRLQAFLDGLRSTGFEDGRNVRIEYRWAEGRNDRLPSLAADLVQRKVNVLATLGSPAPALAAKAATSTIPIVFEMGADPIATGLVASLNRPSGNITGITSLNAEVGPKRLELLHELIPSATGFALLVNPTNPGNAVNTTKSLQAAASARRLQLHVVNAATEPDFDAAYVAVRQSGASGLVIGNDIFYASRSEQLAALSVRHAVPAVHQSREFAVAGGLMGYGGNFRQSHGQAGVYVGRVLKGEKPADLPIQQVTKVEMTVNLKAAKALGLNMSPSFVARADEVIE